MNKRKYTLEFVINCYGWKGGTIHQARQEFINSPMSRKDEICNSLMRHIDDKSIMDIENAAWFFRARIGQS
jgi:hypothetical protein